MWKTIATYAARVWQSTGSLRWIAAPLLLAIALGGCLGLLAFWTWQAWQQERQATTVYQGETADVTTVDPPLLPLRTIPIMDYPPGADTTEGAAIPDLRKIAVAEPREVEVAVTSSALPGHAVLVRKRDPLLPDLRPPSASSEAEVICIQEAGCQSEPSVSVSVPPRPFAEWTGDVGVGSGLYPGAPSFDQARAFYVSASLLRLGPLRLGGQLRETMGHAPALAGLPVDLAPEVSIRAVENVELTGSWGTWQGEPMMGVRVTR